MGTRVVAWALKYRFRIVLKRLEEVAYLLHCVYVIGSQFCRALCSLNNLCSVVIFYT